MLTSIKAHANGRNIAGPNMLHPFALNHSNVGTCWHFFCYGDRRSVAQVAPVCMGSQQCCPRENVCAHVKIVIFFSKKQTIVVRFLLSGLL